MSFTSKNRRSASLLVNEHVPSHPNEIEARYNQDLDSLWETIEESRSASPRKRSKLCGEIFHFTMNKDGIPVVDARVFDEARNRIEPKIQKHPGCTCHWVNVTHDGRRPQVAIRGLWGEGSAIWSETKVYAYTVMCLNPGASPPSGLDTSHRCNNPWCVNAEHLCFEANTYNSSRRYCHMFKLFKHCRHNPPCIDPTAK